QASVLDRSDRSVRSNRQTWTGPIGRSKLFLDRSEIGSVQVQSPVGPVRLHLKKCRSYALDWTGPRPNRGCPSLNTTGELARNCAAIRSFKMDALSPSSKSTVEKVKIVPPFDDITD